MDRFALVSGAGTGIGRAVAIHLSAQDYRLVLMGRRSKTLDETAAMLKGEGHVVALADITDAETLRKALQSVESLDVVVANAGIGGENHYGKNDRWETIIHTNLSGTYLMVNEALPLMSKRGGSHGHILVVSSILARLGVPGYTAYCASKAGLLGLMRSWAVELASENILVNAICPGWVDTQMARDGLQGFADGSGKSLEEVYAEQMAGVLLGKMSSPEEIAALVGYLVSSGQNSITGQTFDINNGALMPT